MRGALSGYRWSGKLSDTVTAGISPLDQSGFTALRVSTALRKDCFAHAAQLPEFVYRARHDLARFAMIDAI